MTNCARAGGCAVFNYPFLTQKERDNETNLDWFGPGRYHSNLQGRFCSVDPLRTSAKTLDPQSWNRYTYALNRPTIAVDPDGLSTVVVTVNPRSANGDGHAVIQVFDKNGNDVNVRNGSNRIEGRAVGTAGTNRRTTNGDTPFGVYVPLPGYMNSNSNGTTGGLAGQPARPLEKEYGTGIFQMKPVSGEVVTSGRSDIYIHGGGRDAAGQLSQTLDANQSLTVTNGCVRAGNEDVNALIVTVNGLAQSGDAVTNIFIGDAATLNAQADEKDKNGNYLYGELRKAGFGSPDPQGRPAGSVP